MRYSVSGGGTGGHIYPALAVARALRDARSGVELDYIGGVRGFERRLVASHSMPASCRTTSWSCARCARPACRSYRRSTRPPGGERPAGVVAARAAPRPPAVFTTGGYLAVPLVLAARARASRRSSGRATCCPAARLRAIGRSRRGSGSPSRRRSRPSRATASCRARRSARSRGSTAMRRARPFGLGPDDRSSSCSAVAGGRPAEHGRRRGAPAPARRVARPPPRGRAGMADAGAARERLPEELRARYTAEPFLTDRMADALVAADLVVGRAGRRPAPSWRRSAWRRSSCRTHTPAPTSATTPRYLADEGAAVVADEELDADRPGRRGDGTARRRAPWRDGGGRAAPRPARRRPRPGRRAAGTGRAAAAAVGDRPHERRRSPMRSSASTRWPASAASSCGATSRWRRSRRCGSAGGRPDGAGRDVDELVAGPAPGSRGGRPRRSCSARAVTSSWPTPASAASSSASAPTR